MTKNPKNCRPVIIAQFGPPALTAIRSWGRLGACVGLIHIADTGEKAPCSRYLNSHISVTPVEFLTMDGLKRAVDFMNAFHATDLLVINERFACHLHENHQMLPSGIQLMFSNKVVTRNVLSKTKQTGVAKSVGFNLLPTWKITADCDVFTMLSKAFFPLCLRPSGTGEITPGFKAQCFFSAAEIDAFLQTLQTFKGSIIAQPFVNSPNLVVHGVRGSEGEHYGLAGFIVNRKFEGVTLTIQVFDIKDNLRRQCMDFVELMDVIGPYHFEFLYDSNTDISWFLELNSRLGGTTAKVMACGHDEPAWTLKAFGYDVEPGPPKKGVIASSKKAIAKYMIKTFKGRLTLLDYPDEARWYRLAAASYGFFAWQDDIFDWNDLSGTLALYKLSPSTGY